MAGVAAARGAGVRVLQHKPYQDPQPCLATSGLVIPGSDGTSSLAGVTQLRCEIAWYSNRSSATPAAATRVLSARPAKRLARSSGTPIPDPGLEEPPLDVFQAGRLDLGRIQDDLWVHTAALTRPVNIPEASAASAGWIIRDEPIWHGQSLRRTKDARSCVFSEP
jgi:hypothetical protein